MEGLEFNNILGEQEIETLFNEPEEQIAEETVGNTGEETSDENDETSKTTEAVTPENLFAEEDAETQPESVGSGSDKKEVKEDAATDEGSDTSPNNFYSSIASALAVDGIFPNLDEETVMKADTAEALSDLIDAEVNARLDERQQRVAKALENGVDDSDIRKYENTLGYIASITDAQIAEESEKGEQLRRNLIYQDFLNKGMTPEKAQKFTERAIDAGTDVEDAREALQSNKDYFQGEYNKLLKEAQMEADKRKAERQKEAEKLRDSIMKDKTLFGDMELSGDVRRKVFENISKPAYRDPETGEYLTALQRYEAEHRSDFIKYVGLMFTLTNGFKDFDSFTKGKVKKEVRKGMRELEHWLNGTKRNTDGSLKLVTKAQEDSDSYIGRGMRLAL